MSLKDREQGEGPATSDEPGEREEVAAPARVPRREEAPADPVEEADEESFPASDPPSWSPLSPGHPSRGS